jgi:hypothetical protein
MEHDHTIHFVFILIPLFLAAIFLLKNFFTKPSGFQIFSIFIILTFSAVHLHPGTILFQHYHQTTDHESADHPCCMPQLSEPVLQFAVSSLFLFIEELEGALYISTPALLALEANSRSPPVF